MPTNNTHARGRILMHRSVRHVRFHPWRFILWLLAATLAIALMLWYIGPLVQGYRSAVEYLLQLSGVPFTAGPGDRLGSIGIPNWHVATFNPVASHLGFWIYAGACILVLLLIWIVPRMPFPLAAWFAALALLLLLASLVLHWRPVPLLTPEAFSTLWGKVSIGTMLIYPGIWALLVGILPLPVPRVALWGIAAFIFFLVWNAIRLAFFLALAGWAGAVWLPIGIVFGGTLPDCLVLITAFAFVMEKAGPVWEEPA